jgi:hypothetical protein
VGLLGYAHAQINGADDKIFIGKNSRILKNKN